MTDELADYRLSLRRLLVDRSPLDNARTADGTRTTFAPTTWRRACAELGVAGLAVPEAAGGQGAGPEAAAAAALEFGRVLFGTPFLSSVVATRTLLAAGAVGSAAALLRRVVDGDELAVVLVDVTRPDWASVTVRAENRAGTEVTLTGRASHVIDGMAAEHLLVPARDRQGHLLIASVPAAATGVGISAESAVDRSRGLAAVELTKARATVLGDIAHPSLLRHTQAWAMFIASAEAAGGLEQLTELATSYAKERMAFARPIGSFQSTKHRCAEMWLAQTTIRMLVDAAAADLAEDPTGTRPADHEGMPDDGDPIPATVRLAYAAAADSYLAAAADNAVIHGGLGFTWEGDAHLYLRRAHAMAAMFGGASRQRVDLGRVMLRPAGPGTHRS